MDLMEATDTCNESIQMYKCSTSIISILLNNTELDTKIVNKGFNPGSHRS